MLIAIATRGPSVTVMTLRIYGVGLEYRCLFIDAKGDIHRFVIGKLFTIAIMADSETISPDDSERVLARCVVGYGPVLRNMYSLAHIHGALKHSRTLRKSKMLCMTLRYKRVLYIDRNVRPKDSDCYRDSGIQKR